MLLKNLIDTVHGKNDIANAALEENFVKNILDAEDRKPTRSRAGNYDGYVHVSSLAGDFCPRHYAIAINEDLALYESVTGGHKVTWAIGRSVETHVRDSFIEGIGRENIYGKWLCECKKKGFQGLYVEKTCDCGKPIDKLHEPDIKDDHFGVWGHPDLVFRRKNKLFVMEIKSMKKDQWDELTEPLPSHIKQALMYPYLLSHISKNVAATVTFVYVTKDFKWGSPYKEFHINVLEEKYVKLRKQLLEEAKQVKDYTEKGTSPERICASPASVMAKKCPVVHRCFYTYEHEISKTT
jgi:hypothetical protein